eukprot:TRINITY_DN9242_c0_g1_i1.p1 TRINITY_DN9242_c0_g1~~TRINITY_DN9242_c0_g1_i1.p1  ORF type:complete len:283 (-),score=34.50 TRINITY_DN9242_c0_g1_i1:60-908(-)
MMMGTALDPTNRRTLKYYLSLRWLCTSVICLFVLALVGYAEFVMVFYVSSGIFQQSILLGLLQCVVWHLSWTALLISYLRTVFTDPGSVPLYVTADGQDSLNHGNLKSCVKGSCAGTPKPERTHHCSTCGTCVLKMDHHCPWVNNCVGFRNYKFFCLFLMYVCVTSMLFVASALPNLLSADLEKAMAATDTFQVLIMCIVCTVFGLGLLCFAGIHIDLSLKNLTTLESFKISSKENPYDLGRKENWEQVFGRNPWYWFIPIFTSLGNGVEYPRNDRDVYEVV